MAGPPGPTQQISADLQQAQQTTPTTVGGTSNPGTNNPNIFSSYATGNTGTTGGTSQPNSTEAPPTAAVSAYEYQQYVATAQVVLGPQLASILGLPDGQPQSGDAIMLAFQELPADKMAEVENLLYQGGFYISSAGQPITSRLITGAPTVDAFNALSGAILGAADSHLDLSSLVVNNANANVGKLQLESSIQPVTGGGNVYQVNLTNPQDVYQTAYQVYEQELGRAPTQTEVAAITAALHSQETAYQQAANTQKEKASQTQYQTSLGVRQAQLTPVQAGQQNYGSGTVDPMAVFQKYNGGSASPTAPAASGSTTPTTQTAGAGGISNQQQATGGSPGAGVAPGVVARLQGADNAQTSAAQPNPTPQPTTPAPGIGQITAPGDTYIAPNTLTQTEAPSAQAAAFSAATTGANAVPYLANQYLNAYGAILAMIKAGGPTMSGANG